MAVKGKTYDTHAIGRRKTAVARVYLVKRYRKDYCKQKRRKKLF